MLRLSGLGCLVAVCFMFTCSLSVLAQDEEEGSGIQFAPEEDSSANDEQSDMIYKDEDEQAPAKPQTAPAVAPEKQPITPAPVQPAEPVKNPSATAEEPKETLDLTGGRRDVLFGSYRVRIGLAQPDFEKLRFYHLLYGDEDVYPTISADWFFWDWYATLGLSFRAGFYTAQGKAAKEIDKPLQDITEKDVVPDPNSKTNLTVLPFQVALTAEITPLRQKWLVVDGYIGLESLYFQEVRNSPDASSSAALIQTTETAQESEADDALTNKGNKQLTVLGFSANILLNGLDGASANSLRGTMGLANIYLSPFIEYSRALDRSPTSSKALSKNPDFSRTTMGIGFTFESIK
jgi:hypothetical protein